MSDLPEITAVREAHKIDESALATYMQNNVDGFRGEIEVRQFEGGQSNPTYILTTSDKKYVLRKQPPGELLPSAHQVNREFTVMKALANTKVPVPRMYALCEDTQILGTKFYIMEMVEGRVFTEALLPSLQKSERRAIYLDLARVLAALHNVNPDNAGLGTFGRPGNYFERQISRWSKQYRASKTEDIGEMDKLMDWLPKHCPQSDEVHVVHGDYRLGNVLVHPTEPQIVAVLDWELSTLGHPLADLGYICMDYHTDPYDGEGLDQPNLNELGIPTEAEFINAYCEASNRPPIDNWKFYLIYNLFRSAGIIQGVYKRGLDGNASSDSALEYKDTCAIRAKKAWELVESLD
ncbi:MAG: phosphotransferase [Pseudomonadales bacterium]|nr:phosphotransferase [Pseudomonadales bacterium]